MARLLFIPTLVVHAVLHVAAIVGCARILLAGRLEARGELERAARAARRGGFLMAGSTLSTVASWPALAATLPDALQEAFFVTSNLPLPAAAAGMLLTVLSGFVGLLAGLSGKPRPTGAFAALLLVAGIAGVVLAAWHLAGSC
jgi:hypothetical protein